MKPKQFIRYTQMLDKRGLAICDGISDPVDLSSILYVIYVISGLMVFMLILMYWETIKDKIRGKK